MAYAAVISLLGAIDGLLHSPSISLDSSTLESLQSVYAHATLLATTLDRWSQGVGASEEEVIIEEARRLEDSIEFPLSTHILLSQSQIAHPTFSLNLDADSFAQTARKMKENIVELWEQKVSETIEEHVKELFVPKAEEEVSSATDECGMVGLFDQFLFIRDKLITDYGKSIWISGMAGIGKTRLAKKLLQDPSVKAHFECYYFVRVGPLFWLEEVLDAITAQLNLHDQEMITEGSFEERFWRIVGLRKSLIVLDDVWGNLNFLIHESSLFGRGTRILVTSREHNDSSPFAFNLKMRFMDEEESWELLKRNVFGEEECPPQLLKPGKKIAKHCQGLPLLINAVAHTPLRSPQKSRMLEESCRETTFSFGESLSSNLRGTLIKLPSTH